MTDSIRTAPRWLLPIAICTLLMAGFVVGTSSRVNAQDDTATPAAEPTKTATVTTAKSTVTEADTSAEFANGDSVAVSDGPLNLREKAGTSNDVVLKLPTGTPLTITDGPTTNGDYDWYEVKTEDGDSGWVAADFISAASSSAGDFATGDTVVVADGPLNIRDDSSTKGTVIDQFQTGDQTTIVSGPVSNDGHDWYEVNSPQEDTGWVAGEFLAMADSSGDSGAGTADYAVGDALTVAVDDMNFRAAAGTDADVLDTLDEGALFVVRDGPVSADGYTWYKVFNYYYGEGWVAGELMTPSSSDFPSEDGS